VAATDVPRLFEAFQRPDGAPPDVGSAGLGLSIAKQVAEAQGGRVTYAARAGGGSVFTLFLPAADDVEPPPEVASDRVTDTNVQGGTVRS
jgi:signal transduction histidine kinase